MIDDLPLLVLEIAAMQLYSNELTMMDTLWPHACTAMAPSKAPKKKLAQTPAGFLPGYRGPGTTHQQTRIAFKLPHACLGPWHACMS